MQHPASGPTRPRLVFLGQGRLGNQVFQWLALKKHFPQHEVWAPSWTALPRLFDLNPAHHLGFNNRLLDRLLRRKGGRALMRLLFGSLRLGGHAFEPVQQEQAVEVHSGRLEFRRGLSALVFADGGYYQNLQTLLQPKDFQQLRLRPALLAQTHEVVQAALQGRPWPAIVMHVRRTDYLHYQPYGQPDVTLPADHYRQALALARQRFPTPTTVLVVTDDPSWCHQALGDLGDLVVLNHSEAVDFAALSMFPAALIANSSFSLAAACVGPQVQFIVAPAYWLGRHSQRWLPPAIRSGDPRFHYI